MSALIDFSKISLYLAIAHIFFNPIFWNTVARAGKHEMRTMKSNNTDVFIQNTERKY